VLPFTLISTLATTSLHYAIQAFNRQKDINILFSPTTMPTTDFNNEFSTKLFTKVDNATKLAMLFGWQKSNTSAPVYMDYAPGSQAICIDTGASACISNNKAAFISLTLTSEQTLQGIGSGLAIAGEGTLRWSINNDDGDAVILHVNDAL
jgi:hypothetical protein